MISILATAVAVEAQDLTLSDALEQARTQAPALAAARQRVEVARARERQAGVSPIHNPELSASWADDWAFAADGERELEVALAQELEIGGQTGAREQMAALDVERATREAAAEERRILTRVAEAFFTILAAQQRLVIAQEVLALDESLLQAAERRFSAGAIPEIERNLIAAEVALVSADVAEAEAELAGGRARLAPLLGHPPDANLVALGDLPPPLDDDPLLALASDRLDVAALGLEADVESARAELLEREVVPNLEVELAWQRDRSVIEAADFGNPAAAAELGGLDTTDDRLLLGLALPLPLFNRNPGGIAEARALEAEARLRASALEREVAAEVAARRAEVDAARRRLALAEGILPQLDRNLALLMTAYSSGYIDAASLLSARDRVLEARLEHLAASVDHALARVGLVAALGLDPAEYLVEVAP